jgi:serine acetyltransferase
MVYFFLYAKHDSIFSKLNESELLLYYSRIYHYSFKQENKFCNLFRSSTKKWSHTQKYTVKAFIGMQFFLAKLKGIIIIKIKNIFNSLL